MDENWIQSSNNLYLNILKQRLGNKKSVTTTMALRIIRFWCLSSLFLLLLVISGLGFEKSLRKMVRTSKKMEPRPFSNNIGVMSQYKKALQIHGVNLNKSFRVPYYHEFSIHRKKSIVSKSLDHTSRSVIPPIVTPVPLRTKVHVQDTNVFPKDIVQYQLINQSLVGDTPENFYSIQAPPSQFFDNIPTDEHKEKENVIEIPSKHKPDNKTVFVRGIINLKANHSTDKRSFVSPTPSTSEDDMPDFLLSGDNSKLSGYAFNHSDSGVYLCNTVKSSKTDLDAQDLFIKVDIEPPWKSNKRYWNSIFESRYEVLMRNPNWPELKVILVPRVHIDSIWKKTFEANHNNTVKRILTNVVKKLKFYNNMTFTWNEVSHLSHWWTNASQKMRSHFRKLVKLGRLEITTGGWVEPDEATSHIFGLVHQLIQGHQWLKDCLNIAPKVGWLTNSVTHSPTMTYILSAAGIFNLVMTNVHFSYERYLAEYQFSDFIWVQNWDTDIISHSALNDMLKKIGNDRYPKHSVLTHYLQFNSAGTKACGPKGSTCLAEYNFASTGNNHHVNSHNVNEKSEALLEQYSKTGTISAHNVIIAPIGGPYQYQTQKELDYQYNNYLRIADFVNANKPIYKATIEFGTPKDYFRAVQSRHDMIPSLKGDFLNFADITSGKPAYWTGYFTTRPSLKILLSRLQSTLRSTEIIYTFAVSFNLYRKRNAPDVAVILKSAREMVARLQDRNVVSGTLPVATLKYVHDQILKTVKNCWFIQEISTTLLSTKANIQTPYLNKYVYRDGEVNSAFKTIMPGDIVYVFNSLSQKRTEVVEFITRTPDIRVIDHNKKTVSVQIDPVWKYDTGGIKISSIFFKVVFAIMLPPMSLESFKISETSDASQNAATIYCSNCTSEQSLKDSHVFPFIIRPIETGDIQLESYKHRLIVDEFTGFLKTVIEKDTNTEKLVSIDYGAFRSSDRNAGMFLFNTNLNRPLYDILMPYRIGLKSKVTMIYSGQVSTELNIVYGHLLQHSIKIYNLINNPLSNAISIVSRVDLELSPNNREVEFFMTVQTGIENGSPPVMYIDNNGFQYTPRAMNVSRRIESNVYPMTTMAYIEDSKNRLTLITDHTQGVTGLQEGQILVMLDRRVLFNDGRGVEEGLADSAATCHRFYILLENFVPPTQPENRQTQLSLPSMPAMYLSNLMIYMLDTFIIDKENAHLCHYLFLPLIQSPFPCDVAVLNYRMIFSPGDGAQSDVSRALLILHRQTFSCNIGVIEASCSGDSNDMPLGKVLRNVKAAYQTNLVGTNEGKLLHVFPKLPPMELTTGG